MRTRAVVFDLFGTLVPKWDTARSVAVLSRMARQLDLTAQDFVEAWRDTYWSRELGSLTVRQSLRHAAESAGAKAREDVLDSLDRTWGALLAHNVRPRNTGVADTLGEIRRRGLKVGLISNCGPEVPVLVRGSDLAPFIDHATFSCEVGIAKPDLEIYEAHCKALGVDPEQSVFIGDGGSFELEGAQRAGMTSVFLRVGEEIAAEGLPEGLEEWSGAEITCIEEILDHLGGG